MNSQITPQQFVQKWRQATLKERSAAQEHFLDLCRLLNHPTPAEDDPTGARFCFEAGANKQTGGSGWADVWKKGFFAWEYKGKYANLDDAYNKQLLLYRESLQNPPLLVVSDIERIIVHSNFTNTVKKVVTITLDDLLTADGMRQLRAIFSDPDFFRPNQTPEQVTQAAAKQFALLAEHLRNAGEAPAPIAHFLIRLLFCLFAEDIDLLPKGLFTRMVGRGRQNPAHFSQQLRQLFAAMATGGFFGEHTIPHVNGGLFNDAEVLRLDSIGLDLLHAITPLDWSAIEPSILGTLFERSLDPGKRSQLGAHYTSKEDILLIVEPVLMQPLRRQWQAVQDEARNLAQRRNEAKDPATRTRRQNEIDKLLFNFASQIAEIRVLDPACGSGNFLYVALRQLLDLGKQINQFTGEVQAKMLFTQASPHQLYGIEINDYAYELAQATVWIGWIQWLHENGYGIPSEPILQPLDNIKQMDAILAYDWAGKPVEPVWPEADVVVGNPPFLGGQKLRRELGDAYVDTLFELYAHRVPGAADLVCYWFERVRTMIAAKQLLRGGLLTTQSIRAGKNRDVLDRIKNSGDIFMAWSDRAWVLDGASVRVSMIGFDDGSETIKTLDGQQVKEINANLSTAINLTSAKRLSENDSLGFEGIKKNGPFEISQSQANEMLAAKGNPNGCSNTDIVKQWANGMDITSRTQRMWLIDFPEKLSLDEAALYEKPFEYVQKYVKPERDSSNESKLREYWWVFGRPRPAMRAALSKLSRFIVTPRVAKHRLFVWLESSIIPDGRLNVFAREDDYFFGILHSRIHEIWSLAHAAKHGVGNDPTYNNRICFETFPFPWPPGQEPSTDPRVQAIAQAAQELVSKRDAWLNPPGLSESELKKRTLTNLYNARPTWLDLAHKKLDAAVFVAYGWPVDLSAEEILGRLLALNLQRAGLVDRVDK